MKTTMVLIVAALIIAITAYYFTQTHDGLVQHIYWRWAPAGADKARLQQELAGKTIDELKFLLQTGPQ